MAFERGRVVWPVGTPEGQTPRASRLSSGRPDHGGVQAVDLSRGLVASGVPGLARLSGCAVLDFHPQG
jgi:hypothetical protein